MTNAKTTNNSTRKMMYSFLLLSSIFGFTVVGNSQSQAKDATATETTTVAKNAKATNLDSDKAVFRLLLIRSTKLLKLMPTRQLLPNGVIGLALQSRLTN